MVAALPRVGAAQPRIRRHHPARRLRQQPGTQRGQTRHLLLRQNTNLCRTGQTSPPRCLRPARIWRPPRGPRRHPATQLPPAPRRVLRRTQTGRHRRRTQPPVHPARTRVPLQRPRRTRRHLLGQSSPHARKTTRNHRFGNHHQRRHDASDAQNPTIRAQTTHPRRTQSPPKTHRRRPQHSAVGNPPRQCHRR